MQAVLLAAGALLALAALWWLRGAVERALVYFPERDLPVTPAEAGLPYEDVTLRTEDGERLGAWWLPGPEAGAPLLLFCHGNAGNRAHRLDNLRLLHTAGFGVLIFDYRGYADSTGRPSEAGLVRDGMAAYNSLAERGGGRPVYIFGRSLGAGVAAQVALRVERERPVAGLILEAAFTSVPALAGHLYPLPGLRHLVRTRFDTLAAVQRLETPLLIIHGETDDLVPPAMGRRLHEAAATPRKTLRMVPGGGHNDAWLAAGSDYARWLRAFVQETAGGG